MDDCAIVEHQYSNTRTAKKKKGVVKACVFGKLENKFNLLGSVGLLERISVVSGHPSVGV